MSMERSRKEKFEKNFSKLFESEHLSLANDCAEECLSSLPSNEYFQLLPRLRKHHGINIDPVYTLVERLISLGEAEKADRLSRHYLCLLGATDYCLRPEQLKDPPY